MVLSKFFRELLEDHPATSVLEIDISHLLASARSKFHLRMPEDNCGHLLRGKTLLTCSLLRRMAPIMLKSVIDRWSSHAD